MKGNICGGGWGGWGFIRSRRVGSICRLHLSKSSDPASGQSNNNNNNSKMFSGSSTRSISRW